METILWNIPLIHVQLTAWKLIGFTGTFLFSARWVVQVQARRRGQHHLPKLFWYMSVMGSSLLLLYFIFGKNDSVGVLSNAFPALISFYNLFLNYRDKGGPPTATPAQNPPANSVSNDDEIDSVA